jgi:hypothetical protein
VRDLSELLQHKESLEKRVAELENAKKRVGAPATLHDLKIADLRNEIFVYDAVITATKGKQQR